jgi:hypothetical protein
MHWRSGKVKVTCFSFQELDSFVLGALEAMSDCLVLKPLRKEIFSNLLGQGIHDVLAQHFVVGFTLTVSVTTVATAE